MTFKERLKTLNKELLLKNAKTYFLVILGCFILSFGDVVFLSKCEIISGGISGISVIANHFASFNIYDIVSASLNTFFLIIGFIFLGTDFTAKSVVAVLSCIGFTFLFNRVSFFDDFAKKFINEGTIGNLFLCGVFGGAFAGAGVGIAYLGGGSTGGFDVVSVLVEKKFGFKESITSFVTDSLIIIAGMFALKEFDKSLCGILSALTSSLLIDAVYIKSQSNYSVEIIANDWEPILDYIQNILSRSVTIVKSRGGFKDEDVVILKVIINKRQYNTLKNYLAIHAPNAFVTFSPTEAVFGSGFKENQKSIFSKNENKEENDE